MDTGVLEITAVFTCETAEERRSAPCPAASTGAALPHAGSDVDGVALVPAVRHAGPIVDHPFAVVVAFVKLSVASVAPLAVTAVIASARNFCSRETARVGVSIGTRLAAGAGTDGAATPVPPISDTTNEASVIDDAILPKRKARSFENTSIFLRTNQDEIDPHQKHGRGFRDIDDLCACTGAEQKVAIMRRYAKEASLSTVESVTLFNYCIVDST